MILEACLVDCGPNGFCSDRQCLCNEGWTGANCAERTCLSGCTEHGVCQNGSCACSKGWNGENCLLAGCLNDCQNHGECKKGPNGAWVCQCDRGFRGESCAIPVELNCGDGQDDDGDHLKVKIGVGSDGAQIWVGSGSAGSGKFQPFYILFEGLRRFRMLFVGRMLRIAPMQYRPDPLQIRLRKIPPSPQASFSQKIQFLMEPESVHQYPTMSLFNESRISVIRGRVVDSNGAPLQAVRIFDSANSLYGFTISRNGGEFDLVVTAADRFRCNLCANRSARSIGR